MKLFPEMAVVASTPLPWLLGGANDGLISLGLGLLGVLLARTIFVSKENRALGRRQPWRETLPITAAACLIAGGIIWDGHLLYSKAIFTGIGIGWSTIVAINQISRLVSPGTPPSPPPVELAREHVSRPLHLSYPARPDDHTHADLLGQISDDPPQE